MTRPSPDIDPTVPALAPSSWCANCGAPTLRAPFGPGTVLAWHADDATLAGADYCPRPHDGPRLTVPGWLLIALGVAVLAAVAWAVLATGGALDPAGVRP